MTRRYFKWWHGVIAGLLVGVGAWQVQSSLVGSRAITVADAMYPSQFVRLVAPSAGATNPARVSDVVVHPADDGKNLVTFRSVNAIGLPKAMEVNATIPFKLTTRFAFLPPQEKTFASVREYLDSLKPPVSYRYAWWEEPRANAAFWIGGPFAVLGIVLPIVVAVLRRFGVMEKPPTVVKEKPSKPEPKAATPMVDHVANASQLEAATAELERSLAAAPGQSSPQAPTPQPVGATFPAPIFTSGPTDPIAPLPEKEATDYEAGVYYPVHRPKRGE